jgi:hypothetical protein
MAGAPAVKFLDHSPVSQSITHLLDGVPAKPDHISPVSAWPNRVLETASNMWRAGAITITLSTRQTFEQHDLGNTWSMGEYQNRKLNISAGILDDISLNLYQNHVHDKLAYL